MDARLVLGQAIESVPLPLVSVVLLLASCVNGLHSCVQCAACVAGYFANVWCKDGGHIYTVYCKFGHWVFLINSQQLIEQLETLFF